MRKLLGFKRAAAIVAALAALTATAVALAGGKFT
jgi:hypothetical protein